jgi:hypothetical protein
VGTCNLKFEDYYTNVHSLRSGIFVVVDFFTTLTICLIQEIITNM